ncbi:MAG TPA: vitamin K epoxide reductase family protein [Actinomycetota bacterium]|nr:vitamin K epoxide reductase family protein [Actinomycetota bacterium]
MKTSTRASTQAHAPAARWPVPASLVIDAGGLAVSAYLTIAHFTRPSLLACSTGGTINCEAVTTSAQSTFLGIPVAVLGLAWFAAMTLLCLPAAWRSASRSLHLLRLAGSIVGIGFALWLVYAELVIIRAICLWCSAAHVFAFALFVVVAAASPALLFADDEPLESR